jgi:DNA-binding response OmpR family regulator
MSYPPLFRILYIGRKAQISDQLETIFEHQNQITAHRAQASSTNGVLPAHALATAEAGLPWPTVEFVKATNQKTALQLVRAQPPVALLVELEQKPASRLRFCEVVRYRLPTVTILAVTAKTPGNGFAFDGVINLPLIPEQVVKTLQLLGTKRAEHLLRQGPIALNMATRTVVTANGQYTMTPKQCALLKLLMAEHGQVVERRKIMEMVWETDYLEDTRTLDVHIRWLRERIEPNPSKPIYLKTVRGVGYCLDVY